MLTIVITALTQRRTDGRTPDRCYTLSAVYTLGVKVHSLGCVCGVDDWKPEMGLKDPYWSPTSPTAAEDNLITSTESEIGSFISVQQNQ